jgi:hypothetical protein
VLLNHPAFAPSIKQAFPFGNNPSWTAAIPEVQALPFFV